MFSSPWGAFDDVANNQQLGSNNRHIVLQSFVNLFVMAAHVKDNNGITLEKLIPFHPF
ncbi:MAG: hypothetical protein M3O71_15755 [Bacteroidota bacterium]|nr:hypothetical protein [Bacteroidota bacterium]